MTIENTSVIDAIGISKSTGAVHLSIFNHLQWDQATLPLLVEKVNRYLVFLEAGELVESYPSAAGRDVAIDIYNKFRPSDEGQRFIQFAADVAREDGITLSSPPPEQ